VKKAGAFSIGRNPGGFLLGGSSRGGGLGQLRPGEIVLRDATRSFSVRADQARTLKGLLLRTRAPGPAAVPALQGVNLHIEPGETVGMVGRNGAGKTSTLRVLAGIVPLHGGQAGCGGRVVSLLELAAGFSRDFSGRENIYLQGALYGLGKAEVRDRIDRIVAFSELGDFIDIPVKTYSSGMFVRLGFSIAAHLDANVLLIDEVLAVGDEAFQRKCLRRISEQIAAGTTVVLVSHDASSIERVCERVVVLEFGRVLFDGPTADGLLFYHRLMGDEHGGGMSVRPHHDRAVEVREVQLHDAAGRSATVFRSGESMRVVAMLKARSRAAGVRLELELRADDGTRLFATASDFTLDADRTATLAFDVPQLTLLGGDYDLILSAGDELALDRTVRFSVVSESSAQGVLDLGGSWRTLVPEPSAASLQFPASESTRPGEPGA
jgi:ABC-type polysaccharide/polyol phosphate transport system ATPase subunit